MMENPKLEDWAVVVILEDNYKAPEQGIVVLTGIVTGHPLKDDGKRIRTSYVSNIDIEKMEAVTTSRRYSLGTPESGFMEYLKETGKTLMDYHKPQEAK